MTTPQRRKVFDFLVAYKRAHDGCAPTIREIVRACGYRTTSAVNYILKGLERDGLIRLDRPNSRLIFVVGGEWHGPKSEGPKPLSGASCDGDDPEFATLR